jgi:hypothetical protein
MSNLDNISTEEKARIFDLLTERIATVRERYERPRTSETFNSVYANGVLAGLSIVKQDFHLVQFEIDKPHPLTDVGHLVDDRE